MEWLAPKLDGVYLLVVVGGDGAMRMAAPAAMARSVMVYHYPSGTENLFAREFGMEARPEKLCRTLEEGVMAAVDVGVANDETFLLMASIGFDAEVVHDLCERRRGAISHLSYVGPMLRQLRRWIPTPLRVSVDGTSLPVGAPSFTVIANSRHYAMRMNPAWKARMDDGVLDVACFPTRGAPDLIGWMLRCETGAQISDPRLLYRTGVSVEIESESPFRYQLDGDTPCHRSAVNRLSVRLQPGALRVLAPRAWRHSVK